MGLEEVPHGSGVGTLPLLDEEKLEVVAGFFREKNAKNEAVTGGVFAHFILKAFGISIHEVTARYYLHGLGFSAHAVKLRAKGYIMPGHQLVEKFASWMFQYRFTGPPKKVCSIDFTYTSHRNQREHTFSPVGEHFLAGHERGYQPTPTTS